MPEPGFVQPPSGTDSIRSEEVTFFGADLGLLRVLVAGDVMLDRFLDGEVSRISPEAPVPILRVVDQRDLPGGAANVARNLATLGCRVDLFGACGVDEAGDRLAKLLHAEGIESHLRHDVGRPTTLKVRCFSQQQQMFRIDHEEILPTVLSGAEKEAFAERVGHTNAVVFSDYSKGYLADLPGMIEVVRTAGKPIFADPKGTDFERYRGVTLLKPNKQELWRAIGGWSSEEELAEKGDALRRRLDLEVLLVTRGPEGMTLFTADQVKDFAAVRREVFDVSGAGDTVIAVLAAAIGWGASLPAAIRLANHAGGIAVGKLGAATVTLNELEASFAGFRTANDRVIDEATLHREVRQAQLAGKRIVMTNGCFDVLHPGHVTYLEQARQLGDYLIVAVNSDTSVARLKGSGRPINLLPARMQMLGALASVDWVIPFEEDTPERLIRSLSPNVLAKGGDYPVDQIAGADYVLAAGGQVRVLPFLDGFSTSTFLARVREGAAE